MRSSAQCGALDGVIHGARTSQGMTAQQLADKCGLTEVDLMDIEAGHADPSIHCLQDIASALDIFVMRGGNRIACGAKKPLLQLLHSYGRRQHGSRHCKSSKNHTSA